MSVAASIPCLRLPNSSPSSPSPSSSSAFRFKPSSLTIRSSQADGPLRRPVAPPPREPKLPSTPSAEPPQSPVATVAVDDLKAAVVTLEYQRQMAKDLQEYFKLKKLQEVDQGPVFGFISKNEINNGRWAMFGFGVGMLTEYATGSNFVDQVKILLSNFGIVDLE